MPCAHVVLSSARHVGRVSMQHLGSFALALSYSGFILHSSCGFPKHCALVLQARMTVSLLPVFYLNFSFPHMVSVDWGLLSRVKSLNKQVKT